MQRGPLADRIVEAFGGMPEQLRTAARFDQDRPDDVALLSMREQARRAGVQPATMTRLAKRLGFEGFEGLRDLYADALRGGGGGFAGRGDSQVRVQNDRGEAVLAEAIAARIAEQVRALSGPDALARLSRAASMLAQARRIYCLGLRSSHTTARQFHYALSLVGDRTVLLDGGAGGDADRLRDITPEDVLLAASVAPYTRHAVEIAEYVRARAVPVIAITDSEVSPLAALADASVLVGTASPSFLHTMAPAFAAAEILAALVAGRGGADALATLAATDRHLASLDTHWTPRSR